MDDTVWYAVETPQKGIETGDWSTRTIIISESNVLVIGRCGENSKEKLFRKKRDSRNATKKRQNKQT